MLEAAVVGARNDDGLESRRWRSSCPASGTHRRPDSVDGHCRDRMAAFKRPRRIVVVDELPEDGDRQDPALRPARPPQRVIIDGVDLDVDDRPGDEPAIVLLHEGLGSIGLWRGVPAALHDANGRRTVTYSRAGYGHSGPVALPRPLTYMHHEADVVLPALLAALGIKRPVLVGHSDGASIALLAAGAGLPVSALVVLAPHVVVEDVSVTAIAAARTAYAETDLRDRLARHHDDVDVAFSRLERRLARSVVPRLGHHRAAARHHRAGAGDPGCRRSLRHDPPARPHRSGRAGTVRAAGAA